MTDGVHVRVLLTRGIKKTPSEDPRLTLRGRIWWSSPAQGRRPE